MKSLYLGLFALSIQLSACSGQKYEISKIDISKISGSTAEILAVNPSTDTSSFTDTATDGLTDSTDQESTDGSVITQTTTATTSNTVTASNTGTTSGTSTSTDITSSSNGPIINNYKCGEHLQKVLVCHVPKGNPSNAHTQCVALEGAINGLQVPLDGSVGPTGNYLARVDCDHLAE